MAITSRVLAIGQTKVQSAMLMDGRTKRWRWKSGSVCHRVCEYLRVKHNLKSYPLNDAAETVNEIGSSIRRVMGGTSGIIYSIFCKAAYAQLKATSHSVIPPVEWAAALEAAIAAVSKYGGACAGYRTLLDALIPAASVLKERLNVGDDPVDAFVLSSEAALAGAESTKHMQAQAGRSTYVSGDILASVPDPGAMAAASWYVAAALAVKNNCNPHDS